MKSRFVGRWLPILSLALLAPFIQHCSAQTRKPSKKLWVASVAALVAANVLDVHSSMNRSEANPLMRDSQGRFNIGRGVLIKSSASGASLLLQVLLFRDLGDKSPYKLAAAANFACAGAVGGIALRNTKISASKPAPDYLKDR